MNAYPCRCRRCGARRTLAREPHLMRNTCRCPECRKLREQGREAPLHCDCGGTYRVDWYRRGKEHKRAACYCSGFPWEIDGAPHRKGSFSEANHWNCHHMKGH